MPRMSPNIKIRKGRLAAPFVLRSNTAGPNGAINVNVGGNSSVRNVDIDVADGSLMFVYIALSDSSQVASFNPPAGWTEFLNDRSRNVYAGIWARIREVGDPTSVNFSWGTALQYVAAMKYWIPANHGATNVSTDILTSNVEAAITNSPVQPGISGLIPDARVEAYLANDNGATLTAVPTGFTYNPTTGSDPRHRVGSANPQPTTNEPVPSGVGASGTTDAWLGFTFTVPAP